MSSRDLFDSVRLRVALALGVLVIPMGVSTMAYWTDRETIKVGSVTAGQFDLKVNDVDANAPITLTATLQANQTAATVLKISNRSTTNSHAAMTYMVRSTVSNPSVPLTAKVTGASAVTGTAPAATCAGTQLANSSSTFGGGTPSTLLFGRSIAAPTTAQPTPDDRICIQATMGSGATANTSTTITFTVSAVQTNPNP